VKEVDNDCGRPHEDVRENRGVDFAEIARKKAILKFNLSILFFAESKVGEEGTTLAINSLFLNSPLTSTTFPFSSNSVHRSLGSLAAFT